MSGTTRTKKCPEWARLQALISAKLWRSRCRRTFFLRQFEVVPERFRRSPLPRVAFAAYLLQERHRLHVFCLQLPHEALHSFSSIMPLGLRILVRPADAERRLNHASLHRSDFGRGRVRA